MKNNIKLTIEDMVHVGKIIKIEPLVWFGFGQWGSIFIFSVLLGFLSDMQKKKRASIVFSYILLRKLAAMVNRIGNSDS